jgi:transposase
MKNKQIVGIDVSKSTLDTFIFKSNHLFQVTNDPAGFVRLLEESIQISGCSKDSLLFCFENTGCYSRALSIFLQDAGIHFYSIDALDLKRSMGLSRGKSDKKDAKSIAMYAWRRRDELVNSKLPGPVIDQLSALLSHREMLIKQRTALKNANKGYHNIYSDHEFKFLKESQMRMIKQLCDEIKITESEIRTIINHNEELKKSYELLLSIKGIGKILAFYLITLTHNFTRFTDPRKFACYAGIAPFEYSSGTSVKGRTKVHPCANKQIKSLLNLAAMSSIQLQGEYQLYYLRRTAEGKNKMSTLNIIRNKLIFRAFSVVKRGTPYVDLHKFAA